MLNNPKKGEIPINFQIDDFIEFYNEIKTFEFENKEGEILPFYDTAKNLSDTGRGNIAFQDENLKLFGFDRFTNQMSKYIQDNRLKCVHCDLYPKTRKCRCENLQSASIDGLYINILENYYPELYFIEIKRLNIYNPDLISGDALRVLDECIEQIDNFVKDKYDEKFKKNLKKVFKKAKKKHKKEYNNKNMLKALQSLISVFPYLYEYYCHEKDITPDIRGFLSFLTNCKKEYIIFYNNEGDSDISQFKAITKNLFDCEQNIYTLQKLRTHPFDEIIFFDLEEELISYLEEI